MIQDVTLPYLESEKRRAEYEYLNAKGPYDTIKHRIDVDEVKRLDSLQAVLDDAEDKLNSTNAELNRCSKRISNYFECQEVLG